MSIAATGVDPDDTERTTSDPLTRVTSATWLASALWDALAISSTVASASGWEMRSSLRSLRSMVARRRSFSSRFRAFTLVFKDAILRGSGAFLR